MPLQQPRDFLARQLRPYVVVLESILGVERRHSPFPRAFEALATAKLFPYGPHY